MQHLLQVHTASFNILAIGTKIRIHNFVEERNFKTKNEVSKKIVHLSVLSV